MASIKEVAESNLKFASSLYQILSQKEGNIFFSPVSIQVILALTYMGAKGKTAEQMSASLHLPSSETVVEDGFQQLITSLKGVDNIILEIANSIFVEQTFSLKSEFVTKAQKHFLSDVQTVDFLVNFEAARLLINKWVEDRTNDKIKDLLAEGILSSDTALVLVNAVYFKGNWAKPFDAEYTNTEKFFQTPTVTRDVQMMHITTKEYRYGVNEELGCKILEIPYEGNRLSLAILLPNEMDGIKNLEAKLENVDLKIVLSALRQDLEVIVSLPKFKLEQFIDLNDVLKQLGFISMFENDADFSGLTDSQRGVKISKVVHKAFIEVNEEGTEAAAATAVIGVCYCSAAFKPPTIFKADHPFVFMLRDIASNAVLFVGRFSEI